MRNEHLTPALALSAAQELDTYFTDRELRDRYISSAPYPSPEANAVVYLIYTSRINNLEHLSPSLDAIRDALLSANPSPLRFASLDSLPAEEKHRLAVQSATAILGPKISSLASSPQKLTGNLKRHHLLRRLDLHKNQSEAIGL